MTLYVLFFVRRIGGINTNCKRNSLRTEAQGITVTATTASEGCYGMCQGMIIVVVLRVSLIRESTGNTLD